MSRTPAPDSPEITPDDSAAPRIFESDYYERMRQLERGSWWNAGMRNVAVRLLSLVSLPNRGTLLDVGCGSGVATPLPLRWTIVPVDYRRRRLDQWIA